MDYYQLISQLLTNSILKKEKEYDFQEFSMENWETFLELSIQHKITPILYQYLEPSKGQINIPDNILSKMRQINLNNAVRNTLLLHEVGTIFSKLSQAGLCAISLKGLHLVDNVYDNISLRSMSDVDILLRKVDIPKALPILEVLGYQPTTYFDINDQNIDIKHVPPLLKKNGPYLELHWTLLEENEPFSIDTHGL